MFCFILCCDLCKCICIPFIVNNINVPHLGKSERRGWLLSMRAVIRLPLSQLESQNVEDTKGGESGNKAELFNSFEPQNPKKGHKTALE